MTPPSDTSVCPSCFLFQATGGRCPPARAMHEGESLSAIRSALRADASAGHPTFGDLVRRDAGAVVDPNPVLALMPGTTTEMFPNTRKEADLVHQEHAHSSR